MATMVAEVVNMRSVTGACVRVVWDAEWEEFRCTMRGAPAATYHTDSADDALRTAHAMAESFGPGRYAIITRPAWGKVCNRGR